ncbi:hypothetical protein LG634_21280 [Streptomyces bambusae]|uniref:hypothetical protein n=1 Tax=Streptomyces bambusae TaxID=1550616 RepID=UPI001CFDCDE4|nr:hypothetical protein [Streptomyces bambusae]MCB5167362.1 hypothetical protein [Streptomyces bambusae]
MIKEEQFKQLFQQIAGNERVKSDETTVNLGSTLGWPDPSDGAALAAAGERLYHTLMAVHERKGMNATWCLEEAQHLHGNIEADGIEPYIDLAVLPWLQGLWFAVCNPEGDTLYNEAGVLVARVHADRVEPVERGWEVTRELGGGLQRADTKTGEFRYRNNDTDQTLHREESVKAFHKKRAKAQSELVRAKVLKSKGPVISPRALKSVSDPDEYGPEADAWNGVLYYDVKDELQRIVTLTPLKGDCPLEGGNGWGLVRDGEQVGPGAWGWVLTQEDKLFLFQDNLRLFYKVANGKSDLPRLDKSIQKLAEEGIPWTDYGNLAKIVSAGRVQKIVERHTSNSRGEPVRGAGMLTVGKVVHAAKTPEGDQIFFKDAAEKREYSTTKQAAGWSELFVESTLISSIDSNSGHYKPLVENLANAVRTLFHQRFLVAHTSAKASHVYRDGATADGAGLQTNAATLLASFQGAERNLTGPEQVARTEIAEEIRDEFRDKERSKKIRAKMPHMIEHFRSTNHDGINRKWLKAYENFTAEERIIWEEILHNDELVPPMDKGAVAALAAGFEKPTPLYSTTSDDQFAVNVKIFLKPAEIELLPLLSEEATHQDSDSDN